MLDLKANGATSASLGMLLSLDMAISACGNAGVAASLLAALAGVAGLPSYRAPLPQAHPMSVLPPAGMSHVRALTEQFHARDVERQLAEC